MIATVLLLAVCQTGKVGSSTLTPLDPKSRPYLELDRFSKMKPISASQFSLVGTDKTYVTRVHRYTYKAKFQEEKALWMKQFVAERHWKVEPGNGQDFAISHDVKHPKIASQALILHKGRIVRDPKTLPLKIREVKDDGWVWVSFNEHPKT